MTFQELNTKLGGGLNPDDWKQHPNGGGWVHERATVDAKAFIGSEAIVYFSHYRETKVMRGGVMWGGVMYGGVMSGGVMSGGVMYGGEMWGGVMYGGEMFGGVMFGGEMFGGVMWGGEWKTSMLFIVGSKHSLSNCKPGYIQIGCQCHTFEWWLKHVEECGKENGYSDDECAEYRAYVELFAKVGK